MKRFGPNSGLEVLRRVYPPRRSPSMNAKERAWRKSPRKCTRKSSCSSRCRGRNAHPIRAFLFNDELAFHAIVPKTTKLRAFKVIRSWRPSEEIKDLVRAFCDFSIFIWVVEYQARG